jgi:hypothetical protein
MTNAMTKPVRVITYELECGHRTTREVDSGAKPTTRKLKCKTCAKDRP